jgi:hypothetical protein
MGDRDGSVPVPDAAGAASEARATAGGEVTADGAALDLAARLAALDVDALTPRAALELIYELREAARRPP